MGFSLGATDLTSTHPAVLSTRTSCELTMSPLVRSTAIPVPSSKVYTSPENFSPVEVTPDTSCPMPQSSAPIVRRPGGERRRSEATEVGRAKFWARRGATRVSPCARSCCASEHLSAPAWQAHREDLFQAFSTSSFEKSAETLN